jgi:hypothetical protein
MRLVTLALVGVLTVAGVHAQRPPAQPESLAVSTRPAAGPAAPSTGTAVIGSVWTGDNEPVAEVTVRLRNVRTGRIEATTTSDGQGRFQFDRFEGGSYVIEVVSERGEVLGVSPPLAVSPGETVATFVRLGSRLPWYSGIFSNAATAAVTTAAGLGVTAMAPTGEPLSPGG